MTLKWAIYIVSAIRQMLSLTIFQGTVSDEACRPQCDKKLFPQNVMCLIQRRVYTYIATTLQADMLLDENSTLNSIPNHLVLTYPSLSRFVTQTEQFDWKKGGMEVICWPDIPVKNRYVPPKIKHIRQLSRGLNELIDDFWHHFKSFS